MPFVNLLKRLEVSDVVTIATATSQGNMISTPVGVVVVGEAGYVRSQKRSKGKWYRRALRTPYGFIIDGSDHYPVTFRPVTDADAIRRVDEATYRKYGGALRSLLLWPRLWRTRNHIMEVTPTPVKEVDRVGPRWTNV